MRPYRVAFEHPTQLLASTFLRALAENDGALVWERLSRESRGLLGPESFAVFDRKPGRPGGKGQISRIGLISGHKGTHEKSSLRAAILPHAK